MTAAETRERVSPLDPCRTELGERVLDALVGLLPDGQDLGLSPYDIGRLMEKPPETALGDYALPCFRFAKALRRKPQDIAEAIAQALPKAEGWIDRVEVVGAFLNLFVSKELMARTVVPAVISGRWFERFADATTHATKRVMIEYSQPNTHKEFHVGHARNVCLGNSLERLYRYSGYQVLSANYFGDEGTHIAIVLWYLARTKAEPPTSNKDEWLGKMYVEAKRLLSEAPDDERKVMNAEISEVLRSIESKSGATYERWLETRQWSLDGFAELYKWLDVHFDILFYESHVSDESQKIVTEYLQKGLFVEDDGAVGVDLKSYKLGFCILRKRDGNTLYATKDLALARRKFDEYKIDRSIYVVGDEQNHHFRQVFKVLELMGFEQAKSCYHLSYGMVVLPEGKMSSRDGTAVSFKQLREMMLAELNGILVKYKDEWSQDEIADTAHRLCDGALKYGMLSTDASREIVFNMADWLSFEGNSGPYLMYGYTRTQSILRKAAEQGFYGEVDAVGELVHPCEHELLRFLYDFNDVVSGAAEAYKPSQLATHLFYTCKAFNRFYSEVSVLKAESDSLRNARLALVAAFGLTLKKGFDLLGIRPPERM